MASGSGSSTGSRARGGGGGARQTSAQHRRFKGPARVVNQVATHESMVAALRGPNGGRRRTPDYSKYEYRDVGRRYYSSREALERTRTELPF